MLTTTVAAGNTGQQSWALLVSQPVPPGAYQLVHRTMVGSGSSTSKLASAYRKNLIWNVLFLPSDKDTTESFVDKHIEMNGISVSKVSQLSPSEEWQKRSAAFMVSFAYYAKYAIFELSLWPSGVEIHD